MNKIFGGVLVLALGFSMPAYADWSVSVGAGGGDWHHDHDWDHDRWHNEGFFRWHDHPRWGYHIRFLSPGYTVVWVGGVKYFYYDGLYYQAVGPENYLLVQPPIGAYVPSIPPDFQVVIIHGRRYFTDNGIYYVLTRHRGYKVVRPPPVVYTQPAVVAANAPTAVVTTIPVSQDAFTINVPNNNGSYTPVVIHRSGSGYVGPQGEYYPSFPTVSQLKAMYVK